METPGTRNNVTIDPVCRKRIDPGQTKASLNYEGKAHFFCSLACQSVFMRNPAKYLKPRNFVQRFLDRLAGGNEREFGAGGPCCH